MLSMAPENRNNARRKASLPAVLAAFVPLAAVFASSEPCQDVLPLPLDRSISGYVAAGEATRYEVSVPSPGFLLIEAHGPASSPAVQLRDASCQIREGSVALPQIRGRHVQRVEVPGTYFVEVSAAEPAERSFRLDAWLVPDRRREAAPTILKAGTDDNSDSGDIPPEPLDEWDELRTPSPPSRDGFRFHAWCPLLERPELLSTFTCSLQVRLDGSASTALRPLLGGTSRIVGVVLDGDGWLAVEAAGPVLVLDGRGRLVAELATAEPIWLVAGRYFLRTPPAGPLGRSPGLALLRLNTVLK